MKTNIYLTAMLGIVIQTTTIGQTLNIATSKETVPFNYSFWNAYADKLHLNPIEKKEFLSSHQKNSAVNPITVNTHPSQKFDNQLNQQNIFAGPCINIDFESGTLNGWNPSSGFHPLFNPLGCCQNIGGQQLVTVGAGMDPAGNFPLVAPGGNFSLRLGNNVNGGEADRIEQTFMVSANNANFVYRYAVVFQDPGHNTSQQPAFQIEMLDSNNVQIPCTFYNVAAGQNIPGFLNSQTQAGVIYKPWSNVMVDLSNYIGQNVTIRFTTYDCALGGHFGYAYIDGSCQAFVTGSSDTICSGNIKNFCAPGGLGSYNWNGPGIVNNVNQCINATAVGIYTCQTTLITGCQGPQFTYTLSHYPNPVVSFVSASQNACAQQYTFSNTSSILSGSIASYNWNFGGGNNSQLQNPVYNFPAVGVYPVTLTATSDQSCSSSAIQSISIYPNPIAAFTSSNVCQNAIVNFTNSSSVPNGSIVANNWSFGNGNTSNVFNPSQNYLSSGTYSINLTVTSDQNCTSSAFSTITIYPLPNIFFTTNNVCLGSATTFTNSSNILSGNIVNYVWDFDNNGLPNSFAVNPSYTYTNTGNYTVNLQAVSNFGCVNSSTSVAYVLAKPTASFSVKNACHLKNVEFTNLSSMTPGGQIINYAWDLGNGTYTNASNPTHVYNAPGNYTTSLTVLANNGCSSTFSNIATVHHLPNVHFSANRACLNQSTQFNNQSSIVAGNISKFRWDFENDGIWDDTLTINPSKIYPESGTHGCKLEASSNFGCDNSTINNVVVYANPVADFKSKPACLGDVSTFTNTSSSADGAIWAYQWDFNGDNIIDNLAQTPSITYTSNGVYLLKLEVQTIYGCTNVMSKSMYVNAKPTASFSAPARSGCPSFCVTFTNSSTISNGAIVNSFWQYGDGSMTEATMGNPTHCYNTGNYDVGLTVISDSGCRSTITKPAYITVFSQPIADFKIEQDEVDENDPVIDVTSYAVGSDQTMYHINDKNTTINSEHFHYVFKGEVKTHPVIVQIVKNQHGCSDTTQRTVKVKPSFAVYVPNTFTPNGDGVNDGWFAKGVGITKFNIMVFDRWGHKLFETDDMDQAWDGHTKGSAEPIKQDVYVWRATVTDVFNRVHDLAGTVTLLP